MDVLELTERAVELASKDEELKEKLKDAAATIVIALKEGRSLTLEIDRGKLEFSRAAAENPDFQLEIAEEDFGKLLTGKAHGMILMATGKLKLVKGSWGEIGKISTPLMATTKYAKQIAEREGLEAKLKEK